MAMMIIGIVCTNSRYDTWKVTFNNQILGDSRGYSREGAEVEARKIVAADPEFKMYAPRIESGFVEKY